jgi:uncharacterized membrane protein
VPAHPLHPALVHFPLGLLLSASIVDAASMAGWWTDARFAALLIAGGLAMALPAMAAGLWDFGRLDDRQAQLAQRHIAAVGIAWLAYAAALYLRRDVLAGAGAVSGASLALGFAGAAALAFGGYLGGELVYRHGAARIER